MALYFSKNEKSAKNIVDGYRTMEYLLQTIGSRGNGIDLSFLLNSHRKVKLRGTIYQASGTPMLKEH